MPHFVVGLSFRILISLVNIEFNEPDVCGVIIYQSSVLVLAFDVGRGVAVGLGVDVGRGVAVGWE